MSHILNYSVRFIYFFIILFFCFSVKSSYAEIYTERVELDWLSFFAGTGFFSDAGEEEGPFRSGFRLVYPGKSQNSAWGEHIYGQDDSISPLLTGLEDVVLVQKQWHAMRESFYESKAGYCLAIESPELSAVFRDHSLNISFPYQMRFYVKRYNYWWDTDEEEFINGYQPESDVVSGMFNISLVLKVNPQGRVFAAAVNTDSIEHPPVLSSAVRNKDIADAALEDLGQYSAAVGSMFRSAPFNAYVTGVLLTDRIKFLVGEGTGIILRDIEGNNDGSMTVYYEK